MIQRFVLIAAFVSLLLAGCAATPAEVSADSTATEPPPTETDVPTITAVPTATVTPPPTETPAPIPTAAPTPVPVGPDAYPETVNPLTGLPVDDPALLTRRPLLIKISNAPPIVRPQSGLSAADILIEVYAEGGWTRFAGLFYSEDADHIGSVRSGRLIDLQLAQSFDAIFVFSGASNGVIDTVRESPLYPYNTISPQFGYGEPYFVRFPRAELPYEHTLFTSTDALRQWLAEQNVREEPSFSTPGLLFDQSAAPGGYPASYARIDYWQTAAEWRYDAVSGRWLRWTDGIPHTDALTGEQIGFENVIVLQAYHENRVLFEEKYFGEETSWYVELQGEGPVTILRDGIAYDGRWVRENPGDLITYYDTEGDPIALKPGRTFIQIISSPAGPYLRTGPEELVVRP